jgi:hypothetical protein
MSGAWTMDSIIIDEAMRLADLARDQDLTLRVLGATAVRIHCPKFERIHHLLGRNITDLDFMAPAKDSENLLKLLEEAGYPMDRESRYRMALVGRYVLQKRDSPLHLDLFFDELRWNHTIDLRNRLRLDFPTLTLSDLLLEKMQIVRINEKDIKDVIMLLREHVISDDDSEAVNAPYLAEVLSKDWGFYYTVTTNLSKVESFTKKYDQLQVGDTEDVISKITQLRKTIEDKPKSLRWKVRATTGASSKWYRDVDELT